MKRKVRALVPGIFLEGKNGEEKHLENVGDSVMLEGKDWANYCDSVRKGIGSGAVQFTLVREQRAAPEQDKAAKAKADQEAKAKAEEAKKQEEAKAKAKREEAEAKAAKEAQPKEQSKK